MINYLYKNLNSEMIVDRDIKLLYFHGVIVKHACGLTLNVLGVLPFNRILYQANRKRDLPLSVYQTLRNMRNGLALMHSFSARDSRDLFVRL